MSLLNEVLMLTDRLYQHLDHVMIKSTYGIALGHEVIVGISAKIAESDEVNSCFQNGLAIRLPNLPPRQYLVAAIPCCHGSTLITLYTLESIQKLCTISLLGRKPIQWKTMELSQEFEMGHFINRFAQVAMSAQSKNSKAI